ncbi:MAG: hypothetical protein HYS20_00905 [Rhodocyclales bacterium]|nr:hypothetical protein [Rhodocyclales bacterium]
MKTFATTLLTMSMLLVAPAFAEQTHHPEQAGAAAIDEQAAPTFERMQDNLKIMQGQLQRAAEAKTDEERRQAMTEHMQTMRESMGMALGMQGGMMNCPMMQGGMGAGMGMMGMMGGGATTGDLGARMHSMEQRMDMMQMMMQRMAGPAGAGGAPMQMPK